jgi:hypothetical protein
MNEKFSIKYMAHNLLMRGYFKNTKIGIQLSNPTDLMAKITNLHNRDACRH